MKDKADLLGDRIAIMADNIDIIASTGIILLRFLLMTMPVPKLTSMLIFLTLIVVDSIPMPMPILISVLVQNPI